METRHTEQYYRKYWADYIKPTNDPHYLNLEESLNKYMAIQLLTTCRFQKEVFINNDWKERGV